ncbi:hypothetical protein EW146_g3505 [Bondarzewia mesenterica]|uniref:Ribosomal protein L1 n=1 Tax=Bondarzewia mesenterica TaxID=1095465 RepID=A0A4S4LXB9_9AGAM|nr:hypothetical protein EW146_g3505 [Bondarzewia mesenterica]
MKISKKELIDEHVSLLQCRRAVTALLDHATKFQQEKQEKELLPGKEQHVWLQVGVKKMYPEKKLKPFKIPLKHPLVDPRTSSVCLITKDPQREYKDLLESHGIRFINRVVGITKLKGKFKPFEARRLLLQENGMFLADERVIPLLPPIPVCLTRKDLKGELERAISSTYMHQNQGTCTSIKIGTISQTPDQVLANLQAALPSIIKHIHDGWENVQNLGIKTNSSASLPLWSCPLGDDEGGRWSGLVAGDDASEESSLSEEGDDGESADEAMDADDDVVTRTLEKGKGKKRAAEKEEATKPKEQAKGENKKRAAEEEGTKGKKQARGEGKKRAAEEAEVPIPKKKAKSESKKRDAEEEEAEEERKKPKKQAKVEGKKGEAEEEAKKPRKKAKVEGKKGEADEAKPKKAKGEAVAQPQKASKAKPAPVPESRKAEAETTQHAIASNSKKRKENPEVTETPASQPAAKKNAGVAGEKKKDKVARKRKANVSAKEGLLGSR